MAGRDKTGPLGAGPGTGRGLGGCVQGNYPQGRGMGIGRGRGCGFGRGMRGFSAPNAAETAEGSLSNRIALLEEKIDLLLGGKKED